MKKLLFFMLFSTLLFPQLKEARIDTTSLSNRVDLKLDITDTTDQRAFGDIKYAPIVGVYGTMGFADSTMVVPITQNVFAKIESIFGGSTIYTAGVVSASGITIAGDSIQVAGAGDYRIIYNLSMSGTNTDVFIYCLFVNNIRITNKGSAARDMSTSDIGSLAGHTILSLSALDWISIRVKNSANSNDLTVVSGDIVITKL